MQISCLTCKEGVHEKQPEICDNNLLLSFITTTRTTSACGGVVCQHAQNQVTRTREGEGFASQPGDKEVLDGGLLIATVSIINQDSLLLLRLLWCAICRCACFMDLLLALLFYPRRHRVIMFMVHV